MAWKKRLNKTDIGHLSLDSDSTPTVMQSFKVAVPASTTQEIFSVSTPVDVVSGIINGPNTASLTATWDDGSTTNISGGIPLGRDNSTNLASVAVPSLENVSELGFANSSSSESIYGWSVVIA